MSNRPPVSTRQQSVTLSHLVGSITGEEAGPRYRRLRDALTKAIEAGELGGGDMLPSSRALADELGLSRNTVNRAYRELVAEGFVEAIERVGYVINRGLCRRPGAVIEWAEDPPGPPLDWDSLLGGSQPGGEDLTKPAAWRDYPYPFVVGPGPETFPIGGWTRAMRTAASTKSRTMESTSRPT